MRSNTEWLYWGKRDPLWAVATHPGRERGGSNPWNDADFYQSGKADWDVFSSHWQRFGLDHDSCLEIGCGAGRITRWLAGAFGRVHGIDVSPEMIQYAKERLDAPNVTLHVGDAGHLPLADHSITAVFSTYVFQHFDSPAEAMIIFREILRVLAPGGSLLIQLPLYRHPHTGSRLTAWVRRAYGLRKKLSDLMAARKRAKLQRGEDAPLMRGTYYEIDWLYPRLLEIGLDRIEFTYLAPEPAGPLTAILLGRRK